jgi:hypothetical protein
MRAKRKPPAQAQLALFEPHVRWSDGPPTEQTVATSPQQKEASIQAHRERTREEQSRREANSPEGQHSITEASSLGFFFCQQCQRVTELNVAGPMNRCARCGSIRIKFCPPATAAP